MSKIWPVFRVRTAFRNTTINDYSHLYFGTQIANVFCHDPHDPHKDGERMILTGDCLDILPTMDAESVQCCVTSPPYYGLRDYGTAKWEGGDPGCDHSHYIGGNGESSAKQVTSGGTQKYQYRDICGKCGATRIDSQIGLESTPEAYVEKLVAVFREVRRVLRNDGTLWLNLGDSYFTPPAGNRDGRPHQNAYGDNEEVARAMYRASQVKGGNHPILKQKDLCGIPWRVAFALQADGWYLRQDIIWNKPNPMPESVTDRCTKSHEYIFLLTKSARYFYDNVAVMEPVKESSIARLSQTNLQNQIGSSRVPGKTNGNMKAVGRIPRKNDGQDTGGNGSAIKDHVGNSLNREDGQRNRRSVWTITTKPFKEAHFATFPPEIPEICIKAGSKPGDVILDPFGGANTTGQVAERLGRKSIIIELNPAYVEMGERREEAVRLPLLEAL